MDQWGTQLKENIKETNYGSGAADYTIWQITKISGELICSVIQLKI